MVAILGPHMTAADFTLGYYVSDTFGLMCLAYLDSNTEILGFDPHTPPEPYRTPNAVFGPML